jgi:Putative transposase DNA-binding domain
MRLTRAVTYIRLSDANASKLAQLDALAAEYMRLCQQYTTAFCAEVEPDKFADAWLSSPLSARWQRAVIQHAAGIAQSWRTNRDRSHRAYLGDLAEDQAQGDRQRPGPTWREWNTPTLKQTVLQANANVVALEPSEGSTFDYWLRISTLDKGQPIRIPVRLAAYHRRVLAGRTPNASMTLTRKSSGWWLTLTVNEHVAATTTDHSPVVGVDVGIANFLTTSTGKRYGSFHGKLARRHKLDRDKRRRKAKLRACLKTKGITRLPSLTNQCLARHVRQEINRAVNQFYTDHTGYQIAYEDLGVRTMRFRAQRMNAYLYASNLAHLPRQLAWGAHKRGQTVRASWAAYSSQACSVCHFVSRANRPSQQTFCCQACGLSIHADENAAVNHQQRFHDHEMQRCRSKEEVKVLLDARHVAYVQSTDARSASARREPAFGSETVKGQSGVGQHSGSRRRKHLRQAS